MPKDPPRVVELDSTKLRALAHPLRSRLLAALRADGPATSTSLAQHLETNTGATSYHLRRLAEVGLIEEDPGHGGGRQRWWRAAHDYTSWTDSRFDADADDRAASDWLVGHYTRLTNRWLEDWLASRRQFSHEWRDAADSSDHEFHLTPERLRALNAELSEVIQRFRRESDDQDPDSQRCAVILHTFPVPHPRLDPGGGTDVSESHPPPEEEQQR